MVDFYFYFLLGLCPVALGADGGGSIRIPAAICGVVGMKPTFDRVSDEGSMKLCSTVYHLGPLCTTVRDAALIFRKILIRIMGRKPAFLIPYSF
jgi:Asp-tRNA(Asn)/Glu-tRNA(Gln) amidotransferase A subunit family amidase